MKKIILLPASIALLLLSGCASITTGLSQPMTVDTSPTKGASCQLSNNKGEWTVPSTPGTVNVRRSYGNLNVNCAKKGHHARRVVESSTKPMVFGNAIFGGVVGAGIDVADGAAYAYPEKVTVPM